MSNIDAIAFQLEREQIIDHNNIDIFLDSLIDIATPNPILSEVDSTREQVEIITFDVIKRCLTHEANNQEIFKTLCRQLKKLNENQHPDYKSPKTSIIEKYRKILNTYRLSHEYTQPNNETWYAERIGEIKALLESFQKEIKALKGKT